MKTRNRNQKTISLADCMLESRYSLTGILSTQGYLAAPIPRTATLVSAEMTPIQQLQVNIETLPKSPWPMPEPIEEPIPLFPPIHLELPPPTPAPSLP